MVLAMLLGLGGLASWSQGCTVESNVQSTDELAPDAPEAPNPLTHDADRDGTVDASDCKPHDENTHPGAVEACDGVDNDCDGDIDEGDYDGDDDGFDDVAECGLAFPAGNWDCADNDPARYPGADEPCDFVDNDCDGETDEADEDADGFAVCEDCDDVDAYVFPGAAEACDAIDNNCDGDVDENWDADGDGYSECEGDCSDRDPAYHPDADETCDGQDNDCDGLVDEDDDRDGDGQPTCEGDCDDLDATVYVGAAEVCDGLDNDCDPTTDESADTDADGYSICGGDCDESSASALPGGTESCDGLDNDCDGYTDEDPSCYSCTASGSYYLCATSTDWTTAESACESLGGTLAMLGSGAEDDDVGALAARTAWIGANDRSVEGDWVWPSGSPITHDNWYSGEPDDSGGQDCAIINTGGHRGFWGDENCGDSYPFVCEL